MNTIVDQVCIDGSEWLEVGSEAPLKWGIPGTITEIFIGQNDPRNFNGCDTAFIEVLFDSYRKVVIKTIEYKYVERIERR